MGCWHAQSSERLRSAVLWTALIATTLAVAITTDATREITRSFASPFSSHDEYRLRHFTADPSSSSSSRSIGGGGGGGGGNIHVAANPGEDVEAAQKRWMAALHGDKVKAREELEALDVYRHSKLPRHPNDGTPHAVLPGADPLAGRVINNINSHFKRRPSNLRSNT